jgi:hypothetical protein
MNEFQEKFKSFDNRKLLKMVEEQENYQKTAIEAAKVELLNRNVNPEEIQAIRNEILATKTRNENRKENIESLKHKAKLIGIEFLETVNPIQKEHQTFKKKTNIIVIIFGLIALFQIYNETGMIYAMFTSKMNEWDSSMLLYSFPIIILPIGVYYFWKRHKIGWSLLTSYVIFNILNGVIVFAWQQLKKEQYIDNFTGEGLQIKTTNSESYFQQPDLIKNLIIVVCYCVTLWALLKKDMLSGFLIDSNHASRTVFLALVLIGGMFTMIIF